MQLSLYPQSISLHKQLLFNVNSSVLYLFLGSGRWKQGEAQQEETQCKSHVLQSTQEEKCFFCVR